MTRISSLLLYVKIWAVGQGVDIMFLSIFHSVFVLFLIVLL